jgi:UDP-glucose 4-epimerase
MEESIKMLADCHDFKYTILRPHNVFGERQCIKDKYRNYIGICMNHIMRNEPIYIYGDGQQVRQFSYIKDSLPCYIKCLDSVDNETINIGGTVEADIELMAFEIIKSMLGDLTHPIIYLPNRYGEVKMAYSDPSKSIDLLGYKDEIGISKGLKNMAEWAKALGPQDWIDEDLAIPNKRIPRTWEKT